MDHLGVYHAASPETGDVSGLLGSLSIHCDCDLKRMSSGCRVIVRGARIGYPGARIGGRAIGKTRESCSGPSLRMAVLLAFNLFGLLLYSSFVRSRVFTRTSCDSIFQSNPAMPTHCLRTMPAMPAGEGDCQMGIVQVEDAPACIPSRTYQAAARRNSSSLTDVRNDQHVPQRVEGWGGGPAFVDLENKGRRDWKAVCFVGRAGHFKPMQPTSPKLQPVEQLLVVFVFYVEFALLCGKFLFNTCMPGSREVPSVDGRRRLAGAQMSVTESDY